jgi:hypothetical protein
MIATTARYDGAARDGTGMPQGVARSVQVRCLVSAVMPCLNEELTFGACIEKALGAFRETGIGEVVVVDMRVRMLTIVGST